MAFVIFDQWRYESQCDRTVQSHIEETHVSLLYRQEYVELFTGIERLGDGVQSVVPSQYQDGPRESDLEERVASVEDFVRASSERGEKETHVEGGRLCETQQEVPHLQKGVFTRLDGRSVCGGSRHAQGGAHVQDPRVGWHTVEGNVLRGGFAEGTHQRSVSGGEDCQTKRG